MLETGKYHKLRILRISRHGAYLNYEEGSPSDDVLLPIKQLPLNSEIGDEIRVFVYMDSEDRIISTVRKPMLTLGECGVLEVVQTTRIGAFLDWGLEKDLFLPFGNQRNKIHKGDRLCVGIVHDDKNRLCATMNVYDMLSADTPYKLNDKASGMVYSVNEKVGAFVAVDGRYHGLIPSREIISRLKSGDLVETRVSNIRKDGKLILSLRKKAYGEIDGDADKLLFELRKNNGFLPYGDKSSPALIKKRFGISKAAFKRAAGRLFKQDKIEITPKGIKLKSGDASGSRIN
jgi:predicted RNA-binding protein (virulence factor B family)